MVVNTIVDKVSTEWIKRVREIKILWYKRRTIDRKKVCSPCNTVKMNDWQGTMSVTCKFWLHYPHPCVIIRDIIWNQPMNKSTRKILVSKCKWEKKECMTNGHALHCIHLWTCWDEHGVMTGIFATPIWVRANVLTVHSTGTTKITRCKKMCDGWMVNINPTGEVGALFDVDISRWNVRVRMYLVLEESP